RLGRRANPAVLVGGGQGPHVRAVVGRGGRGEVGAAPVGNLDAVLGHAPVVSEGGSGIRVAGVGDGAAQGECRPLRAVAQRRGAGDRRRRRDVVHEDRGAGGAYAAVLVGGGQGHDVGAVIVRGGRGEGGAAPRGNVDAGLGHAPVVSEAGGAGRRAGV